MNNMGQIKGHPLANHHLTAQYQWPDADDPSFNQDMEDCFAFVKSDPYLAVLLKNTVDISYTI
jgi:hypothetical protein